MSAIIEYLRAFNSKERFFLIGTALGNPAFRLDSAFRQRLGGTFALEVPSDAFVAMDYHLDWIYAGAYLSQQDVDASDMHPNTSGLVSGTQANVDLIVAFDSRETTHVIMLEAKAEIAWSNKQADSKAQRLTAIFGTEGDAFPQLRPHFGLMSPRPPRLLMTDRWPSWMRSPGGAGLWMELAVPPGLRKLTKCDVSGKQAKDGGYFKVQSTGRK